MRLTNLIYFAAICCLAMHSCSILDSNKEAPATDTASAFALTPETQFDTCLVIVHKVADFEVWKAAYDLASDVREDAGIKTIYTLQGAKDPSLAMAITHIDNFEKAKSYITSRDVQASMKAAGVTDSISVYWLKTRLHNQHAMKTPPFMVLMSFSVLSYDRWEKAYVDDAKANPNNEIEIHQIFESIEPGNKVTMLFSVKDPQVVGRMEKDNGMKMKMMAAGVVSYPEIFIMVPATY